MRHYLSYRYESLTDNKTLMSLKWHYRTYFNNYLVSIGVEDWHPFKLITLSKNPESFLKQLGSIINNGSLFQEMLFNLLPRAIVISNSVLLTMMN